MAAVPQQTGMIDLGSPKFLDLLAKPSNPFKDTQAMVMPSFVNDLD